MWLVTRRQTNHTGLAFLFFLVKVLRRLICGLNKVGRCFICIFFSEWADWFCSQQNLLGLNIGGGQHVKLRLRSYYSDEEFFPFDEVLDTMLHELCHNVHGPHDAGFYRLWDELRRVIFPVSAFILIRCWTKEVYLTCSNKKIAFLWKTEKSHVETKNLGLI